MKLRYRWPKGFSDRVISLSSAGKTKLSWFDWYFSHGKNARLTCRHFGISPDTFYLWKRRFNPANLISLEDDKKTRRPKTLRQPTTPLFIKDMIIFLRKLDPEKSKYEIYEELKRKGIKVSTSTIQRIINRHPDLLNSQHVKRVRSHRKMAITRVKAAKELREKYPGSLVQVDTKHFYLLGKRFYIFAAVDSCTRVGFIKVFLTASSFSAKEFLKQAISYFPFKVEAVQTDNGSEYLLTFHNYCQYLGITHFFTDPYCPKQNGRVERFIQTATYEFLNWCEELVDVNSLEVACTDFNQKYNYYRFHQALDYQTPMEYLGLQLV